MSQITDEQAADLKDRSLNLRALAAASNAFGYASPDLGDYVRLQIAIAAYLSTLSTLPVGAETGEPVAQTERLKLHRKIEGMITDKQRYAGVMINARDLHVIAEALLDHAIEVERAPPRSDKANGDWVMPSEVTARYWNMIPAHIEAACEPEPGTSMAHLRWMLHEIRTMRDAGKANRWLGFVQAMLIERGWTTVTAEREFTRPYLSTSLASQEAGE